jgi:phage tail P2-like protein
VEPADLPAPALPWLAWTLSVDTWDTDWTEERKRAITAGAIAAQRRKGSVTSVRDVLQAIDELLVLVETAPTIASHAFTVRLPVLDADGRPGGPRCSAATTAQIVADVERVAPYAHNSIWSSISRSRVPSAPKAPRRALPPPAHRARCDRPQLGWPDHQRNGRAARR